jgi:integrase
MPKAKLTKTVVDRAAHDGNGNQTLFQDTALPGFGLRVTSAGVKSYIIEYRKGGRKRRVTIGRHGRLTADEARELAKNELYSVSAGEDPAERRQREREGDTLADVAARYLDDLQARAEAGARRGRLSGWESALQLWNRHVPAAMKARKLADVSVDDVRRLHRKLADAGKAPTADHLRTVLHSILERAVTEGLIGTNPAAAIKRYSKPSKRRRALALDELAALGGVLDGIEATGRLAGTGIDPAAALTLRLLALTGMRKSELLGHHTKARRGPREGLRWSDVDLDGGTYTLEAVGGGSGGKGGAPRVLPLGAATVELLRSVRPEDVDPEAPVVASPRDPMAPFVGLDGPRRTIYRAAGIEGADAHCLRHTFESIAFSIAPGLAGALTGRALTRDATLNAYLHVDTAALRDVADKVAGRIAQALAGELAGVVPIESRRA